jgi:hypothetical protein
MDETEGSNHQKRLALLVATPLAPTKKKSKVESTDVCAICELSTISKNNPVQQKCEDSWNKLGQKAVDSKDLGRKYDPLHQRMYTSCHISKDSAKTL